MWTTCQAPSLPPPLWGSLSLVSNVVGGVHVYHFFVVVILALPWLCVSMGGRAPSRPSHRLLGCSWQRVSTAARYNRFDVAMGYGTRICFVCLSPPHGPPLIRHR